MKKLIVILLTTLVLFACDTRESKDITSFQFPFKVGNFWTYKLTTNIRYNNVMHQQGYFDLIDKEVGVRMEVTDIVTLYDTIDTYKVVTTILEEGHEPIIEYYKQDEDFCVLMGNEGVSPDFKLNSLDSKENPDEYVELLQNMYKYPFEKHSDWTVESGVYKYISTSAEVNSSNGKFFCWKILTSFSDEEIDENTTRYEYISADGLIQRYNKVITEHDIEGEDEKGIKEKTTILNITSSYVQ